MCMILYDSRNIKIQKRQEPILYSVENQTNFKRIQLGFMEVHIPLLNPLPCTAYEYDDAHLILCQTESTKHTYMYKIFLPMHVILRNILDKTYSMHNMIFMLVYYEITILYQVQSLHLIYSTCASFICYGTPSKMVPVDTYYITLYMLCMNPLRWINHDLIVPQIYQS